MRWSDADVLWLRDATELADPPSRHAVLWPAVEYVALVFGDLDSSDGLDPFERAVAGACEAGMVSIVEQAATLGLHRDFVAHLHERLSEKGVIDARGKPIWHVTSRREEVQTAVRLYQDPSSGALWPRFAIDDRLRTLPTETRGSHRVLELGTTGSPVEVPAFFVEPEEEIALQPPTSDDAVPVVRRWAGELRGQGFRALNFPRRPAVRVLPDQHREVLLCCPNERVGSRAALVHDPFGGSTWPPFMRQLLARAELVPALSMWLNGSTGRSVYDPCGRDQAARPFTARIEACMRLITEGRRSPAAVRQVRIDLEQTAFDALRELRRLLDVEVGLMSAEPWLPSSLPRKAAHAFGFHVDGYLTSAEDPASYENVDGLASSLRRLLVEVPATAPGRLHEVAASCPDLLLVAENLHGPRPVTLPLLAEAVRSLARVVENPSGAVHSDQPSDNRKVP